MDNQITTTNSRNIFAYTDGDMRAAKALKMMLPYGKLLTDDNAIALLIYGKLHGLDALNGECYFLVRERTDDRGNVKREELGCYAGVKGKRKKAREQIGEQQGSFKIEYAPAEPTELGLNKADIAVCIRAELRDTISTGQYILDAVKMKKEGFDQAFIDSVIGKPPVVVGYGAVKNVELRYIKMSPLNLARKRAETDCLTQRFDLPFAEDIPVADVDSIEYVDAEYSTAETPELNPKSEGELMSELGFSALVAQIVDYSALPEAIREMTNSESVKYIDLPTEELNVRAYSMAKKLKENGLSEEYKANTAAKLEAVRAILKVRNA